jgi:predicted RNA methylase
VTRHHLRLISNPAAEPEHPLIDDILSGPSAEQVADAIARGARPAERLFDRFLPYELRIVSSQYWTPLNVALRVAEWLVQLEIETVVDIGSGAGKFCVAAALATRCKFVGLEQRPRLVEAARELAEIFGVEQRVRFIQGTLDPHAIPQADAYYLYNPFGENLFGPEDHLDADVELGNERYRRDIALMESFLEQAPLGTYLIKYNGFGGQVPSSYDTVRIDLGMPNMLRVWQKTRA